ARTRPEPRGPRCSRTRRVSRPPLLPACVLSASFLLEFRSRLYIPDLVDSLHAVAGSEPAKCLFVSDLPERPGSGFADPDRRRAFEKVDQRLHCLDSAPPSEQTCRPRAYYALAI